MLTYRRKSQTEDMKKDVRYWEWRKIDINSFNVVRVELDFILEVE